MTAKSTPSRVKTLSRRSLILILRNLTITVLVLLTIAFIAVAYLVWGLAEHAVHPPKRVLQEYHQHWLNESETEGVHVTPYDCHFGKSPCLFMTQNINATEADLGDKGQHIRQQLTQDFEQILTPYEQTLQHPKGIILLLHGKNGRKEDMLPIAGRMVAAGFVAVMVDLPAHGGSQIPHSRAGIEISEQQALENTDLVNESLRDVRQWLDKKYPEINSDTLPTFLWGLSLGGSYAIRAAHEEPDQWQGMIIVSSFPSLNQIAERKVERMLEPVPEFLHGVLKGLLFGLFDTFAEWKGGVKPTVIKPAKIAKHLNLPVLIFHGTLDDTIILEQGKYLYDSFVSTDKTWVPVENGTHENVLVTEVPIYATMADWMLNHSTQPQPIE